MRLNKKNLLMELREIAVQNAEVAQTFKDLSADHLNHKPNAQKWSVLECLEHLNLYGDFYLPEMQKLVLGRYQNTNQQSFKPGILGNYFARLMQVNNGKIKKMKAPADKTPAASGLSITVIDRFLKQNELLLSLLNQAEDTDLEKARTPISISRLVKLKLGDTFRFYIYHAQRHMIQAQRAANSIPMKSSAEA